MRKLLQCLANATLVLSIILVSLAIWLVYKVENFAADLIANVDMGVIEAVEGDLRNAVVEFRGLRDDLDTLNDRLAQVIDDPDSTLSPGMRQELAVITSDVAQINMTLARLTEVDRRLSDRQIREIGRGLTEAVVEGLGCRAGNVGS